MYVCMYHADVFGASARVSLEQRPIHHASCLGARARLGTLPHMVGARHGEFARRLNLTQLALFRGEAPRFVREDASFHASTAQLDV